MSRKEKEDEDFDELMREIEREAREAADAHFKDLYEASTGTGAKPGSDVSESIVEPVSYTHLTLPTICSV